METHRVILMKIFNNIDNNIILTLPQIGFREDTQLNHIQNGSLVKLDT